MSQTWPVTLVPSDPDAPAPYVAARGAMRGEVTVRLQALDGGWEVCGADRARGVWPENMSGLKADAWGSKTVGFDLRRDPKSIWPDIAAFTPVQIDIDGVHRWTGRVAQTPTRDDLDSVISVQCEGLQAHLDDDVTERVYVHTKMSDWKDVRSFITADLQYFPQAGNVSSDGGVVLGWPKDVAVVNGSSVGVGLDLGPGSKAARLIVDYTWSNGTGNGNQKLQAFESDEGVGIAGTAVASFEVNPGTGATTGTARGNPTKRYLWIQVASLAGSDMSAIAAELRCQITSIQVFADTGYETGDASVLKSDVIIEDVLDRATVLLSTDRSLVDAGTFNIPEFAPSEPRTPRQLWEAANAFEDRLCKIDLQGRAVFTDKPLAPEIEVGAWSAMSFEDASANDGSEVYSRVIVKGTAPDGSPIRAERTQSQQPYAMFDLAGAPQLPNPTFASNTTGWTANAASTKTRDTTTVDADSASLRWDRTGASDSFASFPGELGAGFSSGTFVAGTTYVLRFRVRANASGNLLFVRFGALLTSDYTEHLLAGANDVPASWVTRSVVWTPQRSYAASDVSVYFTSDTGHYWLDDFKAYATRPTIVERRSFRRTKVLDVSFTLTEGAAWQLGDLWLRAHQRTPFKGTVKLTGTGAARDILTGTPLPVAALLDRTGELLRFSDRIDPDTGAIGRDARIYDVSIDPDTDEATVTLDNTRAGFDALLERLGVVLSQHA